MLNDMTHTTAKHIASKGTGLHHRHSGGQVAFTRNSSAVVALVNTARSRALAVSSRIRPDVLPDVPKAAEGGPTSISRPGSA